MKKIYMLIVPVFLWLGASGEVILTGIMDGTLTGGKPKAIELFIAGTEDLGGFEIWRSQNGDPFGSGAGSIAALNGIYTNTFVYLVKPDHVAEFHSVFGESGFYAHVLPLAIVSGNGNEGYQIRDTIGDVVVDQLWLEDPTDSYRDSYWYRIHGTGPDGSWLTTSWASPGNDALDGLDEAGLRAAVPFGSYAIVWRGLSSDWNAIINWKPGICPTADCNVIIFDTVMLFPVIENAPGDPAECHNLTVLDTAKLTISAGKALTVHGDIFLNGSTVDQLLLRSDSSNYATGSLLPLGTSSGIATLQRYYPKDNSWHFLASPVSGQSIQPGFAPDPLDNTFDMYSWQEDVAMTSGWLNIRDQIGNLNPQFDSAFLTGKGYLVAYSAAYPGEAMKVFRGALISGPVSITLWHENNFWNLLGNPYPCAIDWSSEGIDKSHVAGGAIYLWDPLLNAGFGAYRTHNGLIGVPASTTPIIPSMNGFFVRSIDEGPLGFSPDQNQVLVHSDQHYYKSELELPSDRIRLMISREEYADEALLLFDPQGNNGYEPESDVYKLGNGVDEAPEICSVSDNQHKLCINILRDYPVSVPLEVNFSSQDTLVLSAHDYEEFNPGIGIYLEDLMEGTTYDLRETPVVHFLNWVPGVGNRFILHFSDVLSLEERSLAPELIAYESEGRIILRKIRTESSMIRIYDIRGRLIEQGNIHKSYDINHLEHGVYIIEIINSSHSSRQKLIF